MSTTAGPRSQRASFVATRPRAATGDYSSSPFSSSPSPTAHAPVDLAPYEAIQRHAELELELAGRGEIEQVLALGERWTQLTSGLPQRPPAEALPLLRAARLIHDRTRIELIRSRERLLSEIGTSARARRTADAYAGQLPRRRRLDRSA